MRIEWWTNYGRIMDELWKMDELWSNDEDDEKYWMNYGWIMVELWEMMSNDGRMNGIMRNDEMNEWNEWNGWNGMNGMDGMEWMEWMEWSEMIDWNEWWWEFHPSSTYCGVAEPKRQKRFPSNPIILERHDENFMWRGHAKSSCIKSKNK